MPLVTFAESGNVYCIVRKDGDKLSATIASKSVGKILDLISEVVNLSCTARNARRIQDDRIRQYYIPAEVLKVGMVIRDCNGERIRTYDLERLVIETARMKCALPSDLYKEVISAFRKRTDEIIPAKIGEYLERFPKRDRIERIIDEEVF